MLTISYHHPLIEEDSKKPFAVSNKSYPYNQISSDKRFEELIYSLVKRQLGYEEFKSYDSISLMSGVSELGRDCALFKNGESNGVIQCKKYEKNISKEEFGKEITKFVLYSLLEKKILHNPNIFTYYIAVSKGFVRQCSDFIDSFNHEILSEAKLVDWINYNINKYVSLAHLKINVNETIDIVRDSLSKITVKKIIPSDLDIYLNDDKSKDLASLFFEVKTVTDNELIKQLGNDIMQKLSETSSNKLKLDIELQRGSISLKSERNEFSEIPDSHINRDETNKLFNWINNDLKKDQFGKAHNICLLAGNAGMGKTVILKDLYDKLVSKNIAILGLKADKLASSSIKELQEKIGLPLPIYDFIEECKNEYETTVIVIDQIDALSQSMSSDRSYLQVFKNLIDQYIHDDSIRVIISVRTFDLHYDPSLQLYKNIKAVIVEPLSEEQVLLQVGKLAINRSMLSSKLLHLLKVPNHLNVFSKIYNSNKASLGITTLQDMYQELWRQKVTALSSNDAANKKLTKEVLYKIADKMFYEQHITVSELQFEDYSQELSYLESERLIKKEDYKIQFFHQSFYDFVFAKQFIENDKNLIAYIKDNKQSLLLRSATKMMLNYLREYDTRRYLSSLSEIFSDNEILFHIKHMALSSILFYDQPTPAETETTSLAISNSFHLCILFFERATSIHWFNFALNNGFLNILNENEEEITKTGSIDIQELIHLKNTAFNFLRNAVFNNYEGAWKFTYNLHNHNFSGSILSFNQDWSDPLSYKVFENYKNFKENEPNLYFHTLNNIANINTEYALNKIALHLEYKPRNNNSERDYQERNVLKTLAKKTPEKLFPLLFDIISKEFKPIEIGRHLIGDYWYMQIDLHDKDTLIGREYLFRLLGVCLRRTASNESPEFLSFFEIHKHSRFKPILRLLIFALRSNEEIYAQQIFEITTYLISVNELHHDSTLGIENRIVFEKSFIYLSLVQQQDIIKQIKNIVMNDEIFINTYNGKTKIRSWWGLTKYCWMLRLPFKIIEHDQHLKRTYFELKRKFAEYVEKENTGSVMAGVVQAPLSENAYKLMNKDQWLSSFKKYNGTIGHFEKHFLKGDIEEHSNAFKKFVKDNPILSTFDIIKAALEDPQINIKYPISGVWGWSESNADYKSAITLFRKIITRSLDKDMQRYCLYIAQNLIGNDKEDNSVINFLISSALNFVPEELTEESEQETSINNLITTGINTFSGSAASALVKVKDKDYSKLVFDTLDNVLASGPAYSKAATLFQFAYLMNVDKKRAFETFRNAIINETNIHVLASGIWSLQYMGHYNFEELIPVYTRLVNSQLLGKEDSRWLLVILYGSFLFEESGSKELLYTLISNNKYATSYLINVVLENYYNVKNSKDKNDHLLDFIIDKATEESFDELSWSFGNFMHIKLIDIERFLTKYIKSKYFKISDNFIEYLTFQCNQYPEDAIELFNIALISNKFDKCEDTGIYSPESGSNFIVNALNGLINNDQKSISLRWNLMLAFDNLLKDHRFKADTDRILEELV